MRRVCVCITVLCLFSILCFACSSNKSSSSDAPAGPGAPLAEFTATPISGPATLNVQFTSLSTGTIDSYSWQFGDGGTSSQANPLHPYTVDGTYTVSLTVTGPGGSHAEIKYDYITVGSGGTGALDANFIATPTSGTKPLDVQFTDTSSPHASILTWSWDFGDTGTSDQPNPSHQYTSAGTYTVSLTVGDGATTDTETKVDYITVTDPSGGTDDWEQLTSGTNENLYSISFASATVGWAVGDNATLLYTGNGGDSWTNQFGNITGAVLGWLEPDVHILGSLWTGTGNADLRCVHAASTTAAWATSLEPSHNFQVTLAFGTGDGGQTWTAIQTSTNFEEWGVHAFSGTSARICTMGATSHTDGDVLIVESGRDSQRISIGWCGALSITFADANNGWVVGLNGIRRTTNGGTSWSSQSGSGLYCVTAIDANTAVACGDNGKIIKTTDGTSWSNLTSGVSVTLWGIDFIDANNGWCVGASGTVLVTTDGGANWTSQDSGVTSTLTAVSAVDASHVWISGGGGLILRSK